VAVNFALLASGRECVEREIGFVFVEFAGDVANSFLSICVSNDHIRALKLQCRYF
jgi:hypothetical protein